MRKMLAITMHPVVNPSFESPALSEAVSWHPAVNGWTHTSGMGTTFEAPWVSGSPAPQGDQFAWGDLDNWSMTQAGPTIAANTRYFLTVDLFPLTTGVNRAEIALRDGTFRFADTVYHPASNPSLEEFALPAGQWTTVTVSFNSLDFATRVGRTLQIYIGGSRLAIDNVKLSIDNTAHDFYISSSGGNDASDGFSAATPWSDFSNLGAYGSLLPGERILLKAGDTFTEGLNLRGKGTAAAPIQLTSYGAGANPTIYRSDLANDIGVVWNNASHVRISNIDVEHSKLGIYLRYEWTDSGSTNVTIENCNFRDFPDPTLDPSIHNYEFSWSAGIWVGGQPWNSAEFATRLNNLTIRNITADNVGVLFGTGWYYPGIYKSRITNFLMEDCLATNCLNGSFQLFYIDGGTVRRVHAIAGGGKDTWAGLTMGFAQSSKNIVIEDCEFSFLDRAQGADGSGMDFEGNNENIIFRNNIIHHNEGSAILMLGTDGPNLNISITDNVFYSNASNPWNNTGRSEIHGSGAASTGVISNNGIYRGSSSIEFVSSTNSNWSGFTISNNRQLDYSTVKSRPTWWNFDTTGNLEGWGGFNQWDNPSVAGGALTGQSTSVDPYVESPPTWVNTNVTRYLWVRMSQTAGTVAQVFYRTETDGVWDMNKHIAFDIVPDGLMHDYFVDLGGAESTTGVITQVRLDPTVVGGSNMAVDYIRFTSSTDVGQSPPPAPAPDPLSLTVTSVAAEDGHVLESAQNSGLGGTVDSASTTFRLGDDASNRAYRQFMSFDTSSLPDNARIYEVTIGITRIGNPTGNIPIGVANSQFGDLIVDLATPGFEATGLSANDWQSAATKLGVSKFAWPAYSNQMTIYSRLESSDNALVNLTGKTQFRVRYQNDDDNDGIADYMSYATGNHGTAAFRPTLTVKYYLDQGGIGPIVDSNILDDVVSENSPVGTTVGVTGYAVDPDVADSVSYSLDDNAAGRFAIHPTSGVITVAGVIDRETASNLSITIRATSTDTSFVTTTRAISISDVDEFNVTMPTDNDPTTNAVVEQAANGTAVGIAAVAADEDATTNIVTFSLANNAGGRFAIHATSGVVTVADGSLLDLGAATSHEIIVRATSTDGSTADASFTINLQSAIPIPGDYDSNGAVDNLDYDLWRSTFGSTADLRADGNQDGAVDAADYTVWQDNLGATSSAGGGSAAVFGGPTVPEDDQIQRTVAVPSVKTSIVSDAAFAAFVPRRPEQKRKMPFESDPISPRTSYEQSLGLRQLLAEGSRQRSHKKVVESPLDNTNSSAEKILERQAYRGFDEVITYSFGQ